MFWITTLNSGQSYKDSMLVNYDPRAVIYERKMFIRLATEVTSLEKIKHTAKVKVLNNHIQAERPNNCKKFIAQTEALKKGQQQLCSQIQDR